MPTCMVHGGGVNLTAGGRGCGDGTWQTSVHYRTPNWQLLDVGGKMACLNTTAQLTLRVQGVSTKMPKKANFERAICVWVGGGDKKGGGGSSSNSNPYVLSRVELGTALPN